MVKKIISFIVSVLILAQITVSADDLYMADTRQIYCFSDIMRAYVDIVDKDYNSTNIPSPADISGYIDGTKLTVRNVSRFSDTGEGVCDVFLIDISGSIRNNQMNQVKSAIKTWAANMNPNDKLALITFGDNVNLLLDFSNDITAINAAVDKITNNDKNTRLYGGIMEALKLTDRSDVGLPKRKNIILISDGVNDYSGGVNSNDVYSELKKRLIPVYSMRMSNSKAGNAEGTSTLNSVAEYSGGTTYDMSDKEIDTVYGWIKSGILNSCSVDFAYDDAKPDNQEHTFMIKVNQNGKMSEDSVKFIMKQNDETSGTYQLLSKNQNDTASGAELSDSVDEEAGNKKITQKRLILIIITAALLLLLLGLLLFMLLRNKKNKNNNYINTSYPNNNYYQGNNDIGTTVNMGYNNMSGPCITLRSVHSSYEQSYPLSDSISVGRHASNSFVINNPAVSGKHALITTTGNSIYVEDMGSVNGTFVNGRPVGYKTEVQNGDIVTFGNEDFYVNINY